MPDQSVVDAIRQATQGDLPLQQAMLLGSYLESTWTANDVGDNGTSFGPFQIHLPAHPGVTRAQAEDPVWATNFMLPAYKAALNSNSDPKTAAALTAFHAERPAQMYPANRVNAGWSAVLNAQNTTGTSLTSAPGGGTPGGTTNNSDPSSWPWPLNLLGGQIAGITPAFSAAETMFTDFNKILTKIFLPSTWVRVFAFSVGVVLVLVGLFLFFTKSRTATNAVDGVGRTVASMVP